MLLGDFSILFVAFLWGATNVVIRDALNEITPLWFCGIRFFIAWITVSLFFGKRAIAMNRRYMLAGSLTGMVFILAYLTSNIALLSTTAGNVSFIISMSVVFVPLLVWILTRKFPGWHVLVSVLLCTAGMAGLMLGGGFSVNTGDVWAFASMMSVTFYILLVQKYVTGADPFGLSCWQSFGGMLLALAVSLVFEPFPAHIGKAGWIALVYSGTVAFALTLVLQTVAQKYTTATHAAILLSTSSLFGSILGIIFLDEPMTPRIFIASAMILAGVILVETIPAMTKRHLRLAEDSNPK
jgi:drug/metabolite transporter (DMT)-like permease